jgi:hypothetical protein
MRVRRASVANLLELRVIVVTRNGVQGDIGVRYVW